MGEEGYNGWKNWETWNVALWIGNDEGLYNLARGCVDYGAFVKLILVIDSTETGDGVSWQHAALDIPRLDEMIQEL